MEKRLGYELWFKREMTPEQLAEHGNNISCEKHAAIEMPVYVCYSPDGKRTERVKVWDEHEHQTGDYKDKFYERVRGLVAS